MSDFQTVIGLEVHLQLNTQSKIFCGCANTFGQPPNTQTCPVCLGLPGSLPVFNRRVLDHALKIAMALHCNVNPFIKFDRKNYYYPDLPKGYQISQYDLPIANNGFLEIKTGDTVKRINIRRAHLEEDAGKLIHDPAANCSLVDYNRAGTPLMEIVTEPDIHSPQEAYDYLTELKLSLQYLDVSDCDMEKGSLRCDANISIRKKGAKELGTKAELKNMNSFKAVKAALEFEENRQAQTIQAGEKIAQETRLWNEQKQITISMRSKEEAHDYRYFPEPDLVPFTVDQQTIEEIRKVLPESPAEKFNRFLKQYALSEYDTQILIQDKNLAAFFEECTTHYPQAKKICNWIIGPLAQELNTRRTGITTLNLKPGDFTDLVQKVDEGILSNLTGKNVLSAMIDTNKNAQTIISEKGLAQVSDDSTLEKIVDEVIRENEKTAAQIKEGKENAIGFLVGQAMRKTNGKANPKKLGDIIKRRIQNV
ncbi:MAG TPA: Asp-tRNA(Asn)/Glu-tRNA(Gln) amidotransferase subunit GatB [Candidatus Omnitrophota bacterium]|nr:Asp-tRNA(Asn)/Glu-tRNA(Gln) amidotransferase subunit GatB [Candidatus Omnitrophota bacterium]HPD85280.1 Asp-tRNA(Asn)/Glu-tRNA(Gln) amidotransferase subunit GatB [Candidatus Omnitrophota bacterium]HRZ04219.1 Asp-tRNA(Asn)/Glu-tRNA(Gln) amidotransferase subunit GatB [Candidatus Omnitrophota bacterium]